MIDFDESFFQKEVRCDFEIPELMKRVWAAQMEVLELVVALCKKHNLQYFADSGTLLGAVRHRGFIPWDDDIDICLKRADYNRFAAILKKELPVGYVISGVFSEDKRLQRAEYAQQMRVIAEADHWDYALFLQTFHGYPFKEIGIDIFPFDYIPRDPELASVQKSLVSAGIGVLRNWNQLVVSGKLEDYLQQLEMLWGVSIPRDDTANHFCLQMVDNLCSMFHEDEADELTNIIFYNTVRYRYKKEWMAGSISVPFENISVEIPVEYDKCLTSCYGNYKQYVKFTSSHTYPYFKYQDVALLTKLKDLGFSGTLEEFCRQGAAGDIDMDLTDFWKR